MERKRIYLCLAHMSEDGAEQRYVKEAFDTNWVVPLGPNVNAFEQELERFVCSPMSNEQLGFATPHSDLGQRMSNYDYSEARKEAPIIINSGYRSAAVNKAVGGAPGSNHLTGSAVDIRCKGIEQAIRYAFILLDISEESQEMFDELLIEKSQKSVWVHFAVRPSENRHRVDFLNKK